MAGVYPPSVAKIHLCVTVMIKMLALMYCSIRRP